MGSLGAVSNLLLCMKFWTLVSYCSVSRITRELPLSARAIMALLLLSSVCMDLMVLFSECVFSEVWELFCRVLMRLAVSFLYTSLSEMGSFDIAVSASSARFCIQFFFL